MLTVGPWSISTGPTVTTPTSYTLVIKDALDSTNDAEIDNAATINWLRAKVSAFTEADDWDDLAYADFTADGTGTSKTPNADYTYLVKVSGTDLVTKWYCTDDRVFDGYIPEIVLGTNNLYIYNETEDLALSAYSPVGGTTFNQTDYRDWNVVVNCIDASEAITAEVTSLEGYGYGYDPSVGAWLCPVIAVTFNTTATNAFGEIQDTYTVSEAAAATVLYFEINCNLSGSTTFDLKLGTGLSTTFEVTQIAIGWGYSGSFTQDDSGIGPVVLKSGQLVELS
jgi:hypothetical protein